MPSFRFDINTVIPSISGKKFLKSLIILILVFVYSHESKGQIGSTDINLEQLAERIFAVQDQDLNYEELYEFLYQLYLHPIDLNNTNPEELQATYLLSPLQINQFFEYKQINGQLISIYELQAIPGFDLSTIHQILPFVSVKEAVFSSGKKHVLKNIAKEKSVVLLRYERTLETKKGFSEASLKADSSLTSRYLGSPDKLYLRLRTSSSGNYSWGITAEKDPGEQLLWDPSTNRYGADFWSFHFSLHDKGRLKMLIVGDYQLQVGQGLLLGAGFAPGKGAETITTIRRGNVGVRPYTSVIESGYFRGISSTIGLGKIDITSFYSNAKRDATQQSDIDSLGRSEVYISSIQATGFHRTPNEIAAKSDIREQVGGINIQYRPSNNSFTVGLASLYTTFDVPIKPTSRIYNQFEFRGRDNFNIGTYFNISFQNLNLFGEAAISKSGGKGMVAGAMMSLSKKWEMSLLLRRYARNFHTLYGSSFSENSRSINEYGSYLGLKYTHSTTLSVSLYFDQFRFPWLKYRVDAPSQGHEILGRINYFPSKRLLVYAQYRRKAKEINVDVGDNLNNVEEGVKQSFLVNLDFAASKNFNFRTRIQFSDYKITDQYTQGLVLSQDLNVKFRKLKISARAALFDTEDYENRQYVYEKDVLYAFSIPAYFGIGVRNYLLFQYNLTRTIDLWFRIAKSTYRNQDTIGSGLEAIDGSKRTDVKFQVRYKF